MRTAFRWGILGTGVIARAFASDLGHVPGAALAAVGSRTEETARAFASDFNCAAHGSYEALLADSDIDAVYIATPHSAHAANSLLAIEAGKAVLCEKPFTLNAAELAPIIRAASERGVFVMEAMWVRFLPAIAALREMIANDAIGEVLAFTGDFSLPIMPESATHRLLNPHLGGGALLDLGVYPIAMAAMVLGPIEDVTGVAKVGATGVDVHTAMSLRHARGGVSSLSCSFEVRGSREAWVLGTRGRIHMHAPFYSTERLTVMPESGASEAFDFPFAGGGYQFQAMEVMRCARDGSLESSVMPLDESMNIMSAMDRIRGRIGVIYPTE